MLVATALQSRERELCLGQEHAGRRVTAHDSNVAQKKKNKKQNRSQIRWVHRRTTSEYGRNNLGRLSSVRRGRCTLVLREDLLSRAPQAPDDTSPKHSALLGPPSVLQVLNELC